MVIYWDLALLLNLITTVPWLWATGRIAGQPLRWVRIALASVLGSLGYLLWEWADVGRNLPLALLGTLLLLQVAFGPLRLRPLIRVAFVFLLLGATAAGLSVFGLAQTGVNSPFVLLGVSLMAAGAHLIYTELVAQASREANRWEVRLTMAGRSLQLTGLLDTGHQLRAPFTGHPVLLVAPDDLIPLLGKRLCERLCAGIAAWDQLPGAWKGRVSPIRYQTVAGEGLLPAFRPDGLWLQQAGGPWRRVQALVGVTRFGVGGHGDYQVLLPPLLLDSLREVERR